MAEADFAVFCRSLGIPYSGPQPRNAWRSARRAVSEHLRAERELREVPADANHRLPFVPAGRGSPRARQRARLLVWSWTEQLKKTLAGEGFSGAGHIGAAEHKTRCDVSRFGGGRCVRAAGHDGAHEFEAERGRRG